MTTSSDPVWRAWAGWSGRAVKASRGFFSSTADDERAKHLRSALQSELMARDVALANQRLMLARSSQLGIDAWVKTANELGIEVGDLF